VCGALLPVGKSSKLKSPDPPGHGHSCLLRHWLQGNGGLLTYINCCDISWATGVYGYRIGILYIVAILYTLSHCKVVQYRQPVSLMLKVIGSKEVLTPIGAYDEYKVQVSEVV